MSSEKLIKTYSRFYISGFMGAGKSVIGSTLAKKLGIPFQDLDLFIERKENTSIAQIFQEKGESEFRSLEWKYLLELSKKFRGVISLGGGALQNQHILDHLKITGLIVFIDSPLEIILERVHSNPKRPIVIGENGKIKDKESLLKDLKVIYSKRIDLYNQAQIKISTTQFQDIEEVTTSLIHKLNKYV